MKPIRPIDQIINPFRSEPAERFGRTIDRIPAQQPSAGGGGSTTGDWPLKLTQVDTENVKALLGTISGFVPTDVNTDIDMSGEDDGEYYFYYHVTIDADGAVTAAALEYDSGGVPADSAYESYRLAGLVEVASAEVTSVTNSFGWSQSFSTCNRDPEDPETTPGQYYWQTGA
jgi:hypothetical protein